MNTVIKYTYWDKNNNKMPNKCIINGELTLTHKAIIFGCLKDGECFIPSKVGLPEKRFGTWTEEDDIWFELPLDCVEFTEEPANVAITPEQLVSSFCQCKNKWEKRFVVNKNKNVDLKDFLSLGDAGEVISDWLYDIGRNDKDALRNLFMDSPEYKQAVELIENISLKEFPEMYEAFFVDNGIDLIFQNRYDKDSFELYYYNPDSNAGGQIVQCSFNREDIPKMINNEDYIDILAEYPQYLSDVDTDFFFGTILELMDKKIDGLYLGNNINKVCGMLMSSTEEECKGIRVGDKIKFYFQNEKVAKAFSEIVNGKIHTADFIGGYEVFFTPVKDIDIAVEHQGDNTVVTIKEPEAWRAYTFDVNGNQVYYKNSDNEWYRYEYDSDGNMIAYRDSGGANEKLGDPVKYILHNQEYTIEELRIGYRITTGLNNDSDFSDEELYRYMKERYDLDESDD